MSQIEILGDHPREEEEDHHAPPGHPREVGVEEVGVEVVGVEEEEEEHFHYLDTHLPNQLKNF